MSCSNVCHTAADFTCLAFVSCKRYKYTYMEEMLGNVAGCRQVFERWMEWEPDEQAWHSYINFELRYKEVDKARTIYERYILFHVLFGEQVGFKLWLPVDHTYKQTDSGSREDSRGSVCSVKAP